MQYQGSGMAMTQPNVALVKQQLPPGYKVEAPELGVAVIRVPKIIYQDSGTSNEVKNPGNTYFRMRLPSDGVFDFSTALWEFDVRNVHTAGTSTYFRQHNGIWNMFNRIRLLQGGTAIVDVQFWNNSYDLKWLTRQDPVVEEQLGELLGIGTTFDRNTWASGTKTYACPLDSGFLNSGPIPFGFIANEGGSQVRGLEGFWDLEMYLEDADLFTECDYASAAPTYYLSNIKLHVEKIEGPDFCIPLANKFRNGSTSISWKTIDMYENPCFQVSQMLKIAHRARYVDWIVTVFADQDVLQDITAGNNRRWNYPKLTLEQFQFKDAPMGGQNSIFPSEAVDTKVLADRAYWFYLLWVRGWVADGFPDFAPNITLNDFNGADADHGLFLVIGDFRSNKFEDEMHDNNIVNLFSSDRQYNDIKLDLRFTSAPSISTVARHFIQFSVVTCFTRQGGVEFPNSRPV